MRNGVVLEGNLRRQRMNVAEIRQAIRSSGRGSLADVAAVVLESDSSLSVIGQGQVDSGWALGDVPSGDTVGQR